MQRTVNDGDERRRRYKGITMVIVIIEVRSIIILIVNFHVLFSAARMKTSLLLFLILCGVAQTRIEKTIFAQAEVRQFRLSCARAHSQQSPCANPCQENYFLNNRKKLQ